MEALTQTSNSEMIYENENSTATLQPDESADLNASSEDAAPAEPPTPSVEEDSDRTLGELDSLRAEVERLKTLLSQKEQESTAAIKEMEDFHRLFPEVSLREIPHTVLEMREKNALPLNAAYALYERELQIERARADAVNRQNASRSAGRAGTDTASEYFSADEVRKMTPKQVHENFSKIRESMKSWSTR